ncbi:MULTISPECIES: exonuclease SbcCD subunit D [unclassified Rathayibacter]|uniref:exonuclease SbcCD subunit D n=1 Tax=unclassified Rathayibacter TaxID=2609250 RepID=UPI001FB3F6AD|nr:MULTISPECIES: exonuclease SbcCD subunit D [unclassified Rathayibacter]MCJ1672989.1 exonuclease SbcCD subunit D [Rathayibacter sp. VKM Ac-2929]MCJ1682485.1 exonuclease SbcCD subunit D [Rathayibacter sp. VKM Ac-2928]
MKLLHTSDWHIGRTFHGHSSVAALGVVLDALVETVRSEAVDVVLISGDVFDSAVPAAEHYTLLTRTLEAIRAAGAEVVLTSGNHDSPARLGFQAGLLRGSGVHVLTDPEAYAEPVVLRDGSGLEVGVYGIPYLEPALYRHRHPDESLRRHEDVLAFAMRRIRAHAEAAGRRWVVLAHCFAVGAPAGTVERDITAGGIDYVSVDHFAAADYAALGHIHGRAILLPSVRYSGAPLHYSFGEASKPRGGWLVELGADGLGEVTWSALPVPRRLSVIEGRLDELLSDPSLAEYEPDWVSAVLTDEVRPLDAMARLQSRFPGCVTLEHRPPHAAVDERRYAERIRGRSDVEVIDDFLAHVRGGHGASETERALALDALAQVDAEALR